MFVYHLPDAASLSGADKTSLHVDKRVLGISVHPLSPEHIFVPKSPKALGTLQEDNPAPDRCRRMLNQRALKTARGWPTGATRCAWRGTARAATKRIKLLASVPRGVRGQAVGPTLLLSAVKVWVLIPAAARVWMLPMMSGAMMTPVVGSCHAISTPEVDIKTPTRPRVAVQALVNGIAAACNK